MNTDNTEFTYTRIPEALESNALCRWVSLIYTSHFGYVYSDGSCSCWDGKNGKTCQHIQEWLEIESDRLYRVAERVLVNEPVLIYVTAVTVTA